ncbi:alanine racemase [Prosthecomicrobium pneumaticum]|uniref:Alanine racemase n=1 Tax=Prosthecomicrobium pneumaticum TaxID=81895 RepID=A0A7W9FKU1_9HYPH|nr:alanine racemase [Prosthecomicrobium pneumaticum]MBB5751394.1 alanine racemase [Prosthecomicrobium pneumaticum]
MQNSSSDATALPARHGARVRIDLPALAANYRTLAAAAGGAETAAAVKGDAYGIGIEPATRTLARAGCRTFFVALPKEGAIVRATAPEATVYVLSGLAPGAAPSLAAAGLRPVLGSMAEIEEWAAWKKAGGEGRAAIHVDTGMNRLGLTLAEAAVLAADPAAVDDLAPALVMSHLACADTPDHPLNALQAERFAALAARFPGRPASLANSAGIHLGAPFRFDLVRPGIALYGGRFGPGPALAPVATVTAPIVQVREVPGGETIGYGAAETLRRPTRAAILSIGYADGYPRAAGGADGRPGAFAFVEGHHVPLIGRVSMDLVAIDVTDVPSARRGVEVELFGPHVAVDAVAEAAGTIGYELLTRLGARLERVYAGGG